MDASTTPLYAGFWRRAAAALVDSFILMVPNYALIWAFGDGALGTVLPLVVMLVYYASFHASASQATPGKMAFGIKVTGMDGERIGIGRAIARVLAWALAYILLLLGLVMAAFTRRKQGLHDLICGTLVVRRAASPEEVRAGGTPMPLTAGVILVAVLLALVPALGILAAIAIPAYQDYVHRSAMMEVIAATQPIRNEVENALANNRPIPAREVRLATGHAAATTVSSQGTIVVRLAPQLTGSLNSQLVLEPPIGAARWKCTAVGVRPQVLPATCRQ